METPSSLLNPRLGLLHQKPGPNCAQKCTSNNIDFTSVAGPSSAISSDTPGARLHALLAHPPSSPNGRCPLISLGRNHSGMSETDVTPVVNRTRERRKGKRKSLDEDDKPISPPSSLSRESGSPIQIRALVSTSAASFNSVPDSPLKSSGSDGEEQTMPPSSIHGTPPLASSISQDGPASEVKTHDVNVTLMRVNEDSFARLNYTVMKTPRPPGAWTITPVPLKHASRATSPPPVSSSELTPTASSSSSSSSWTSLSRANSGPERRSKPEAPAGNGPFTPIHPLSRAKSLHVRTPASPGTRMSTTTQNWSNEQSKSGSTRTKKNILKVRFDVTESEASTAEVEHQVPPVTDMPMPAPDSLPNGHASRSGNVPQTRINGSSQGDAVDDPVLARPVTPGRRITPASRANAPSSRPQRKAFSVKVVDAFGRERIDKLPVPIANGRADAGDAICASPSAKTRTPRVSSKNEVCIIHTTGREVQEDVPECSSILIHDDPPICRTAALAHIRQTLREWVGGLSDEDRNCKPPDNLASNPSYSKELEERSRAARRSRNQLAQTLRIESVKECKRNSMHKYTKGAEDRSGLLPIISASENGSFHRDLVWVGVLLQIVFVFAMWRFAHVQARHLFCAVYYDPLYPDLNPRIGGRAWETWAERPNAETWPPT